MSRKIGFGENETPTGPGRFRVRVFVTSVLLCVMGGIGGAMALSSLQRGEVIGFAVGAIWCVALVSFGASKLIKHLLGFDRPRAREGDHDWSLDDQNR